MDEMKFCFHMPAGKSSCYDKIFLSKAIYVHKIITTPKNGVLAKGSLLELVADDVVSIGREKCPHG